MKTNQKGFSAIEALLILVIVGMLGGVGWYVWHSQKQVDKTYSQTANSSVVPKTSQNNNNAGKYADWITYCDPLKVGCIKYPSDWVLKKYLDPTAQGQYVDITAPQNSQHKTTISYELTVKGPTYTADELNIENTYDLNVPIKNLKVWKAITKDGNAPIIMVADPSSSGDPDKGGKSWYLDAFPGDNPYDSKDKADAWFASSEGVTALKIVQSYTTQQK